MRIAAFFDFDKTLLATDCASVEWAELWDDSWRDGRYYLYLKFCVFNFVVIPLYVMGFVNGPDVIRWYMKVVYRDMYLDELEGRARILYTNKLQARLYPEMVQRMHDHKARGHLVFVVSASPEHLLRPFADDYKAVLDGLAATKLETDIHPHPAASASAGSGGPGTTPPPRQRCTGRPVGNVVCIGAEKERVQERFAEQFGIDLKLSYAYSDHHYDMEFLEAVKHPSVVNPTGRLEEVAKKRDWPIIRISLEDKEAAVLPKGEG